MTRFLRHLIFACHGFILALKRERHLRFHLVIGVLAIFLGIYFDIPRLEWMFLLLAIFLVIICELMNTAIEKVVDYISVDIHPMAKFCKDVASSAVLAACILSLLIGFFIFFNPLKNLFLD